ncbi:LOW QUALITY PROTEIN: TOX high mobility group box family member 4-like [Strix uralensis]|uniref:LOW QUALITY PROTEIN: TOX high mobility group box family member 4-like n=1 Tax=Strix uralensis TaxID=36305 RepID=UPI003DA5C3B4
MEFPGGSDNYLAITGAAHPFLTGAETFHTPSLGDEEFEIPPIALDADPSLAVSDVVGHFEDLGEPGGGPPDPPFPPPPYGVQGLEMPVGIGHGLMEQGAGLLAGGLAMELDHTMGAQYTAPPPVTIDVPMAALSPGGLLGPAQLTTIDQSELSSQLGLSLGGAGNGTGGATGQGGAPALSSAPPPRRPSPEERLSPTPSPTGSLQEEEAEDFRRTPAPNPSPPALPAPPTPAPPTGEGPRRGKPPKKPKKKKDPNEPQKPVSAYALFFRDTQAAIKGQNPNATFGEVSKIVASMWDSLGEEQKQVYKRKTEAAKKEYLKALAAYRAILTSTEPPEPEPSPTPPPPPTATPPPPSSFLLLPRPPRSFLILPGSPQPPSAPPNPPPATVAPPNITKIIIPKQMLPPSLAVSSQGGVVTVIPATVVTSRGGATSGGAGGSGGVTPIHLTPPPQIVTRSVLQAAAAQLPRLQPPPLQQMPPPQPPPQPITAVLTAPPPLQAMQQPLPQQKPRPPPQTPPQTPPPLQIKILPPPALQIQPLHLPPEEMGGSPQNGGGAGGPPQVPNSVTSAGGPPPAPQIPPETVEMIAGDVVPEVESPTQMAVELVAESPVAEDSPRCVRAGCDNPPVASGDWDEEYCSSECVVKHCRDVFLAWLAARNAGNSVVFVK